MLKILSFLANPFVTGFVLNSCILVILCLTAKGA